MNQEMLDQIAEKGNEAWEKFMEESMDEGKFPDGIPAARVMAGNFSVYKGKYMPFKEIDFGNTVKDKDGNQYYGSEDERYKGFILQFSPDLQKKMQQYSFLLGKIGTEGWEIIGEIYDVYTWWFSRIFVKLVALRVEGKFTAFFKEVDGEPIVEFVGEDLLVAELEKLESAADDIPAGLTEIPAGADPVMIGNLFYHLCIKEDNFDLWVQLYTTQNQGRASMLRSIYNSLRKKERVYFHVGTDIDQDNKKKFRFQMKIDGEFTGPPKPITIIQENGEWRIDSASV